MKIHHPKPFFLHYQVEYNKDGYYRSFTTDEWNNRITYETNKIRSEIQNLIENNLDKNKVLLPNKFSYIRGIDYTKIILD